MPQDKPWERYAAQPQQQPAPSGPMTIGAPSPKSAWEGPTAEVDYRRKQADLATAPSDQRKAAAEAKMAEIKVDKALKPDAPETNEMLRNQQIRAAQGALGLLDKQEALFNSKAFTNNGLWGSLQELNPFNPQVSLFNNYSTSMLPYVKQFMRSSGEGANSDADQRAYADLLPQASTWDEMWIGVQQGPR